MGLQKIVDMVAFPSPPSSYSLVSHRELFFVDPKLRGELNGKKKAAKSKSADELAEPKTDGAVSSTDGGGGGSESCVSSGGGTPMSNKGNKNGGKNDNLTLGGKASTRSSSRSSKQKTQSVPINQLPIPCMLYTLRSGAPTLLVHCHSNGCDIGDMHAALHCMAETFDSHVLSFDFPGYGLYEGKSSMKDIDETCLAILDYIENVLQVDLSRVIWYGRSIGSGPAINLAHTLMQRNIQPAGVIIQCGFSDFKEVVGFLFGRVIKRLVQQKWNNYAMMGELDCPVLLLHGKKDKMIPHTHAEALWEQVQRKERSKIILCRCGHNDFNFQKCTLRPINDFLHNIREFNSWMAPTIPQLQIPTSSRPRVAHVGLLRMKMQTMTMKRYSITHIEKALESLACIAGDAGDNGSVVPYIGAPGVSGIATQGSNIRASTNLFFESQKSGEDSNKEETTPRTPITVGPDGKPHPSITDVAPNRAGEFAMICPQSLSAENVEVDVEEEEDAHKDKDDVAPTDPDTPAALTKVPIPGVKRKVDKDRANSPAAKEDVSSPKGKSGQHARTGRRGLHCACADNSSSDMEVCVVCHEYDCVYYRHGIAADDPTHLTNVRNLCHLVTTRLITFLYALRRDLEAEIRDGGSFTNDTPLEHVIDWVEAQFWLRDPMLTLYEELVWTSEGTMEIEYTLGPYRLRRDGWCVEEYDGKWKARNNEGGDRLRTPLWCYLPTPVHFRFITEWIMLSSSKLRDFVPPPIVKKSTKKLLEKEKEQKGAPDDFAAAFATHFAAWTAEPSRRKLLENFANLCMGAPHARRGASSPRTIYSPEDSAAISYIEPEKGTYEYWLRPEKGHLPPLRQLLNKEAQSICLGAYLSEVFSSRLSTLDNPEGREPPRMPVVETEEQVVEMFASPAKRMHLARNADYFAAVCLNLMASNSDHLQFGSSLTPALNRSIQYVARNAINMNRRDRRRAN